IERGKDISYAGEDIPRGLVFGKGHLLRPQDVEVLACLRLRRVRVFSKPRVAIISVGDELCEVGDRDPSKRVNSHALNISGLVQGLGAVAKVLGVVEDKVKTIRKSVKRALDETDIALTIAGVSIGEEDFVTQAVSSFPSAKILAHGVAMKPGKPTLVAVVKGKPLIGLPGHVASTNAAFYAFATNLIEKYSGARNLCLPTMIVELDEGFKSGALYSFVRFKIRKIAGRFVATPLNGQITLMREFVRSNGFAILPPRTEVAMGDRLPVTLYSIHEFHHIAGPSPAETTASTFDKRDDVGQAA
ncbi:molybdopterin molybdotransferase MoeA, partial [[Eubacterium] cellulosolvens]